MAPGLAWAARWGSGASNIIAPAPVAASALIIIEATAIDDAPISAGVWAANLRNTSDAVLPGCTAASPMPCRPRARRSSALLSHSGRNTSMGAQGQPPRRPRHKFRWTARATSRNELEFEEIAAIPRRLCRRRSALSRWRIGWGGAVLHPRQPGAAILVAPPRTSATMTMVAAPKTGCAWREEVLHGRARAAIGPEFNVWHPLQCRRADRRTGIAWRMA